MPVTRPEPWIAPLRRSKSAEAIKRAIVSPASNDPAGEIAGCLSDLIAFCRISSDPPHAEHTFECHELKVLVDKLG
jgi:hypothetical protein